MILELTLQIRVVLDRSFYYAIKTLFRSFTNALTGLIFTEV